MDMTALIWSGLGIAETPPCKLYAQYCIYPAMYDYDPNKVSMSRLRRAYELNDHFAAIVMAALWPHALFPLELWRKTHDLFWRGFADGATLFYSIDSPVFPEFAEEKYFHAHLYAQDMENLFSKLASRIHVNALREGLRYIVSMTYENIEDITFQDKMDSLFEKLSTIEKRNNYIFTQRLSKGEFASIMEEKIISVTPTWYYFISRMYQDTILVDTVAAIRHLHFLKIPFKNEVKGTPRALVESVHKELAEEAARKASATAQAPEQSTTPSSTGSRKDIPRINASRQISEEVAEELLRERQQFLSNKAAWKQRLLFDNGTTNWKTFLHIVETRLGCKPHYVATRTVWLTIPDSLKHDGRVREQ